MVGLDAGNQFLTGSFGGGSGVGSFIAAAKVPGLKPTQNVTAAGAVMTLITMVVGAGVITLPAAVGGAGIIAGFGMVVFCGIISIDTGRIICNAATVAEELGHSIRCYEDIGYAAMGTVGMNISMVVQQLMYFLIACIFISLTGQYLGMIVDTAAGMNHALCEGVFPFLMKLNGATFGGWMLVGAAGLVPTLFLWNMSFVAKLAPMGIGGAFVLIVCMIIGSLIFVSQNGVDHENKILVDAPGLSAITDAFVKSIFSYFGTSMVPTMRQEMIHPEQLSTCVVIAMTLVTCIYFVVCIPAVLAFGQPPGALLGKVQPFLLYAGSMGVVVHVFVALPTVLNVFYNTCSLTILPVLKTRSTASVLIRFAVLLVALILSVLVAKLGALVDLVTASTMVAAMIILPVLFNLLLLKKKEGSLDRAVRSIGYFSFAWQVFMCVVGLLAAVFGVQNGIKEVITKSHCPLKGLV